MSDDDVSAVGPRLERLGIPSRQVGSRVRVRVPGGDARVQSLDVIGAQRGLVRVRVFRGVLELDDGQVGKDDTTPFGSVTQLLEQCLLKLS